MSSVNFSFLFIFSMKSTPNFRVDIPTNYFNLTDNYAFFSPLLEFKASFPITLTKIFYKLLDNSISCESLSWFTNWVRASPLIFWLFPTDNFSSSLKTLLISIFLKILFISFCPAAINYALFVSITKSIFSRSAPRHSYSSWGKCYRLLFNILMAFNSNPGFFSSTC